MPGYQEELVVRKILLIALLSIMGLPVFAQGSNGYGSLSNFDCVNDNDKECHGFEIEIEDVHSTDVTYTYDWNHYGTPRITEDNSDPLHSRTYVTYASRKNPDGSWAAYTAVPAGPINPTDGHQFTNPNVNFGGEHFGVGLRRPPTNVRYHWLVDDGFGNLVRGTAVNIGTPTFTYFPPVNNAPAQVQAVIEPPEPVEVPVKEFGEPSWLKVITTETHNNNKVELRDLVSDDPDDPEDTNWRNGEPEEIEVEWQLLQVEFNKADGGNNGFQEGNPEDLPDGDEIITRRYEFFKYAGPIDEETGEALADNVGPDDLHGDGVREVNGVEVDLSTVVVVGDYIGAQMAGFDAAGQLGLIDHLQDGEVDVPYVDRSMVIGGTAPVVTTLTGSLPPGMDFDAITGILSGTPTAAGLFTFNLASVDGSGANVTMAYDLTIAEPVIVEPPHYAVVTAASPAEGGTTLGDGDYESGALVSVAAIPSAGFSFVNWTENGEVVSVEPGFDFAIDRNRDLVANFDQDPVFREVGDLVSIAESGKSSTLNRRTRTLSSSSQVRIENVSETPIEFPIQLVITGLGAGVSVPGAAGTTESGEPYLAPAAAPGQVELLPGQSISVSVTFVYPMTARLAYGLEAWGVAP